MQRDEKDHFGLTEPQKRAVKNASTSVPKNAITSVPKNAITSVSKPTLTASELVEQEHLHHINSIADLAGSWICCGFEKENSQRQLNDIDDSRLNSPHSSIMYCNLRSDCTKNFLYQNANDHLNLLTLAQTQVALSIPAPLSESMA
ncbi:hypothetical protein AAMO2058_001653900 [Amorphochlora amoebiformis]